MKQQDLMKAQPGIRALKFLSHSSVSDAEIALENDKSAQIFVTKALVGAISQASLPAQAGDPVAINLASALVSESLIPALIAAGASVQPFYSDATGLNAVGANWIGEGLATPVTKIPNSGPQRLVPRKIAALAVVTDEIARLSSAASNDALTQVLGDSTALQVEQTMLSDGAATDARPQGLLNGATESTAGNIAGLLTDHAKKNSLKGSVVVLDSSAALALAGNLNDTAVSLARLGVSIFVTSADLAGKIVAINAKRIVLGEVTTISDNAKSASLQLVDASSQNANDGSGAAPLTSMFQTNSVALRAITFVDWHALAGDAVTYTVTAA